MIFQTLKQTIQSVKNIKPEALPFSVNTLTTTSRASSPSALTQTDTEGSLSLTGKDGITNPRCTTALPRKIKSTEYPLT